MAKKQGSKKPKQADLPGMEERKLPDLHKAAEEYAEVRDERLEIQKREIPAKQELLRLMKVHKKETYKFEDVSIRVVHEKEKVIVRIGAKKDKEED